MVGMALGGQPLEDKDAFWLSGPLPAVVAEAGDPEDRPGPQKACLPLAVTEEVAQAAFEETRTARLSRHKRRKLHGNWTSKEAAQRDKVFGLWSELAAIAGPASALFVRAMSEQKGEGDDWRRSISDAIERRATSTLAKRAASMFLFTRWAAVREGSTAKAFPFQERMIYEYLKHLREELAPATRAKSFLEAITLAGSLLEIGGLDEVARSNRITGVMYASYRTKRLTVKARALRQDELAVFEIAVTQAACLCDQYFAGFICWLVYTRTRFGDSARITEVPSLDMDADGVDAFGEASAFATKTGGQGRRARVPLPVVAPACGITGRPWMRQWLEVRAKVGIEPQSGLMPTPRGDGCSFLISPITSAEASTWMHEILVSGGLAADSVRDLRTHSCRATLLSWAAKFGIKAGHRRLLGYHAKPKDQAMLEYSRDSLAAPLRELCAMLDEVANGSFVPDSTRSGYFARSAARVGARARLEVLLGQGAQAEPSAHSESHTTTENSSNATSNQSEVEAEDEKSRSSSEDLGASGSACGSCVAAEGGRLSGDVNSWCNCCRAAWRKGAPG
jgi:hypothetical protein